MADNRRLATIEHLKEHVRETLVAYQTGAGADDKHIFTVDQAIRCIWRRLEVALGAEADVENSYANVLSCRLQVIAGRPPKLEAYPILTVSCVCARDNDTFDVYYLTMRAETPVKALALLAALGDDGVVGNWRYGC